MCRQSFPGFFDRFHQCVTEFLVSEMRAHSFYESPPELLAALFMDRFVAYDRKLVGARRHKNEHGIALRRFVHSEPMKFFLRGDEWIYIQLSALNENTNLAGSFRFGIADRLHDLVVFEFAEKFFRSHRITSSSQRRRRRNRRRRR
jgi:hypothetical protein